MSAIVFDGESRARVYEQRLAERIDGLGFTPRMMSVVFSEDEGSQLYTRLKFEAAMRVGVEFDRVDVSLTDGVVHIQEQIRAACGRRDVQGVMIQKPTKRSWREAHDMHEAGAFSGWWRSLASQICLEKDVDCLNPMNLEKVYAGEWHLLPATVMGILRILEIALKFEEGKLSRYEHKKPLNGLQAVVVGRSDIVGRPLAAVLGQQGAEVEVCGSKTEDLGVYTSSADVIVTAVGKKHLISEDIVKDGAVVVDVGSPEPDVDFEKVKETAGFITPVPYGVGPMTVVSLLTNLLQLVSGYEDE